MSKNRCQDMGEQVLFDILLYLPAMSLLRFKSVCKYWFSLIASSIFISEHLNLNRDNKEDNLIIRGRGSDQGLFESKFALLSGRQYEECVYDMDIGKFWHPADDVSLTGYCDGIVLLTTAYIGDESALCNPVLKQLRLFPPPLFSDRLVSLREHRCIDHTSFGIDGKSNDYKLVRILLVTTTVKYDMIGNQVTYDMIGNQVEVYNLGGDNCWRIIHKDDVLPFHDIFYYPAISSGKNGMCFWMARHRDYTSMLLSFDFNDDVFRTMLLPDGNQVYSPSCHYGLDLLDDKVVYIVQITTDEYVDNFEIWMLREFGVEYSWSKLYRIGPVPILDLFYPIQISKNGEFLTCTREDNMLYLYNLHTQRGKYHQNCNLVIRELIHYNASVYFHSKVRTMLGPTE